MHIGDFRRPSPAKTVTNVGAVLVFKEGVTKAEAEEAIKKLQELLEYKPQVYGFNSEWGSPVWYIP